MKKQFVTYEIALKLKKLGFNEECFSEYNDSKILLINYPNECFYGYCDIKNYDGIKNSEGSILAPLWQQAIDWLHMKYNLCVYVKPDKPRNIGDTEYVIEKQFEEGIIATEIHMFPYDAREMGILKALELIKQYMKG